MSSSPKKERRPPIRRVDKSRPAPVGSNSAPAALREEPPPYRVAETPVSDSEKAPNGTPGKLRFIDLFCGIGGFRIAFERAGAKCVFSSDWDKFSQQTYAANFIDSRCQKHRCGDKPRMLGQVRRVCSATE